MEILNLPTTLLSTTLDLRNKKLAYPEILKISQFH